MSKKLSLILGALSLGALLAWSSVRPEEAEATVCFVCDDYFSYTWNMTYHYDVFLFDNDSQGNKHSNNSPGGCGQHLPYSLGGGGGGCGGGGCEPE
jgi:uncharacterized membrane protein YgcG